MRICLAVLLCAVPALAQVAGSANKTYQTEQQRQGMLATLSAPDRAARLRAEAILAAMELKPGMTVADLGTGGGAMLPSLSAAVGPSGKVIAEDIFPDFLARARKDHAALPNITYLLGTEKDARLPRSSVDVALTVDAYHHYDYPAEMLAGIRAGLKPGGRFVVVDYLRRPGAMDSGANVMEHIRLDREDVIKEVESNGFRLLKTLEHVPGRQYIAVFVLRR